MNIALNDPFIVDSSKFCRYEVCHVNLAYSACYLEVVVTDIKVRTD